MYEQNSIVKNVHVDDYTAERAIIANNVVTIWTKFRSVKLSTVEDPDWILFHDFWFQFHNRSRSTV